MRDVNIVKTLPVSSPLNQQLFCKGAGGLGGVLKIKPPQPTTIATILDQSYSSNVCSMHLLYVFMLTQIINVMIIYVLLKLQNYPVQWEKMF